MRPKRIVIVMAIVWAVPAAGGVFATKQCTKWPLPATREVSYSIASNFRGGYADGIRDVVTNIWNRSAPIQLKEVPEPPQGLFKSHIRFIPLRNETTGLRGQAALCWQSFGNVVEIRDDPRSSDSVVQTVLHELGHTFGLIHEFLHCRSEQYFKISLRGFAEKRSKDSLLKIEDYVRRECLSFMNFDGATSIGDWDPLSVMNYDVSLNPIGAYEFTKMGLDLLDANGVNPGNLGKRMNLSRGDVEALKQAQGLP